MFNSNLVHNILNIVIAILAGVSAFLLATGCVALPSGQLDCSASWIDATYTTTVVSVLAMTKTAINIVRDGLSGLARRQPPVDRWQRHGGE